MVQPKITQAMIAAYDEYTHLTLDRRAFMRKLRSLAGSGAAAAVIAPLLAANKAAAEIVPADDGRLITADLTYRGAPGDIKAYAAMPKDAGKLPALPVSSSWKSCPGFTCPRPGVRPGVRASRPHEFSFGFWECRTPPGAARSSLLR